MRDDPRPRWELDGHDEGIDPRLLALQGETDFLPIAGDIRDLMRWTPDGILRTSPARVAARLALPVADVLDTLELFDLRKELRLNPATDTVRKSPVTDTIQIQMAGLAG